MVKGLNKKSLNFSIQALYKTTNYTKLLVPFDYKSITWQLGI